uniref:Uncharacterized protein n=1 Tax=Clytia hemisphaerica TaxID=252671 RepID=A0A7M5XI60_9CNID
MAMELKEMNSEVIFCSHLKMKSVKLEIQYKGKKKQGELFKSLQGELKSFKLDGSVQIKGVWRKFETTGDGEILDNGSIGFTITMNNNPVSFSDFGADFQIQLGEIAGQGDAIKAGAFGNYIITGTSTVKGYYNLDGDFQLVLSADMPAQLHNTVFKYAGTRAHFFVSFMTVNGKRSTAPKGANIFELPAGKNVIEILNTLLTFRVGLRGLPMLRRIHNKPYCIIASKMEMKLMGPDLKDAISRCYPDLNVVDRAIPKGLHIPFTLKMKEALGAEECGATAREIAALPEDIVLNTKITMQGVKFEFHKDYDVPARAQIRCFGASELSAIPFDMFNVPGEKPIFQIQEFSYTPSYMDVEELVKGKPKGKPAAKPEAKEKPKAARWNSLPKYDSSKHKMFLRITFVLTIPDKYSTIPHTSIGLGPIKFHIDQAPTGWKITGLTTIKIKAMKYNVNVAHALGTPGWKFILQIPKMFVKDFYNFVTGNGDADLDTGTALDSFGIQDLRFEYNINRVVSKDDKGEEIKDSKGKPKKKTDFGDVKLRGNPIIAGYSGATVEAMWWATGATNKKFKAEATYKSTGKKMTIVQPKIGNAWGIFFANINLDWIIEKVFKYKVSIPFFSNLKAFITKTNAAGMIDPASPQCIGRKRDAIPMKRENDDKVPLKDLCFTTPGLNAVGALVPDINAMLLWDLPKTVNEDRRCKNSAVCKFLVSKLHNVQNMQLQIFYNKANKYLVLTASITANIPLSKTDRFNIVLRKAVLRIAIRDFSIKILGTIIFEDRQKENGLSGAGSWELTGSIEFKLKSLMLAFTATGNIPRPGPAFQFRTIHLGGGYNMVTNLPAFELALQMWIGKELKSPSTSNLIKLTIAGGLNGKDFFFYGNINKLTIESACKAFREDCDKIPTKIRGYGLTKDSTVSLASEEKIIENTGIAIPKGFAIMGGVKIWDIEAWGKVLYGGGAFELSFDMKPVSWASGLIQLKRSNTNEKEGPKFQLRLGNAMKYANVHIEGYARVLAMEGEVKIFIEETKMHFKISGPLFLGLTADCEVEATYGSLQTLSFKLKAALRPSLFIKEASKYITAFVGRIGDAATSQLRLLRSGLAASRKKVSQARQKAGSWKKEIQDHIAKLEEQKNELDRQSEKAQHDKCYQDCPRYCIKRPGWGDDCESFWDYVYGCVEMKCEMTRSPVCLSKCLYSEYSSKISVFYEKKKLQVTQWISETGGLLLDMADGVLQIGETMIKMKEDVLKTAEDALGTVVKVAQKVASGKFLSVQLMEVKLSLSQQFDACGEYTFKGYLFSYKVDHTGNGCLTASFMQEVVFGAARSRPEIEDLEDAEKNVEKVKQDAETTKQAENDFNDRQKEATDSVEKEITDEFFAKQKRGHITMQELDSLIDRIPKDQIQINENNRKLYEPVEQVDLKERFGDIESNELSKWQKAPEDPYDMLQNVDVTPKKIQGASKRSLVFEEDLSPCGRVRKSITHYDEISKVLLTTSNSIIKHQNEVNERKRDDIEKLATLKNEIVNLDERFNTTQEDQDKAWFLYDQAANAFDSMAKKSDIILGFHKRNALPILRRQLNYVFEKETGHNLHHFFDVIHHHAIRGYKRSNIPGAFEEDGEQVLHRIKRGLQTIILNNDTELDKSHDDIIKLRDVIQNARQAAMVCQDKK